MDETKQIIRELIDTHGVDHVCDAFQSVCQDRRHVIEDKLNNNPIVKRASALIGRKKFSFDW